MKDLSWCKAQKNGIELIEPNKNLSKSYLNESRDTLSQINLNGNKWNIIMAYYACYNALYAILQIAGIKCEIHDCTISLMTYIAGFEKQDQLFLAKLKEDRIANQYYLEQRKLTNLLEIQKFILKCEKIAEHLNIEQLRKQINDQ